MSPAFQFYPADWLADAKVAMSTLEQEGAYIRLLSYAWREGSIPACPKQCAALIGKGATEELARVVQGWFNQSQADDTKLVHPRLEKEREKQRSWSQKSASGGKKSAEVRQKTRANKGGSTTVSTKPQPKVNSSSSSLSSSSEDISAHAVLIQLWEGAYPLHHDGGKYLFQGGKDAKAVSELLKSSGKTPQQLMAMAQAAWGMAGFHTSKAATLNGFFTSFNDIRQELNNAREKAKPKDDRPSAFRVAMIPAPTRPEGL